MLERRRRPTIPGEILVEHYLKDRNISLTAFADATGCTRKHISHIVHGKTRIEADFATRIAAVLGTSAQLWINLQNAVDLWDAKQKMKNWKPKKTFPGTPYVERGPDGV